MNVDLRVEKFLNHLESNGNLERFTTRWDNKKSPVHRWFPFLAGFSNSLVKETVDFFNTGERDYLVFDPFMGTGTTGVVCKERGVNVWGSEINPFLFKICEAKLTSPETDYANDFVSIGNQVLEKAMQKWNTTKIDNEHELLTRCYPTNNLKKLITLRNLIADEESKQHYSYLFVILNRCLSASSSVGINVPYVSWSSEKQPKEVFATFQKNLEMLTEDLSSMSTTFDKNAQTKVFLHDSRLKNPKIEDNIVDLIFTSPPYLNNLDYGESLKVFLYFWKITENWKEITKKIRKVSLTSATTHYEKSTLSKKSYEDLLGKDVIRKLPSSSQEILQKAKLISEKIKTSLPKRSRKSFDILTILYFKDMFSVLSELKRILKDQSYCFMVIGDCALYDIHVPVDTILGEMGIELGFSSYTLKPLRIRGTKWKNPTYRHNQKLRESLLILRR